VAPVRPDPAIERPFVRGIGVGRASPTIEGNTVVDSRDIGIQVHGGTAVVRDNRIRDAVRGIYGEGLAKPDELTLARIGREREEASQRLARTRDIAAWQATMARLDAEQQVARQPRQHHRMAPDEVVAYLRSLPSLWRDAGPEGRQALASALFSGLEVEGAIRRCDMSSRQMPLLSVSAQPCRRSWSTKADGWVWSGREG
jgi:hypothetical protein